MDVTNSSETETKGLTTEQQKASEATLMDINNIVASLQTGSIKSEEAEKLVYDLAVKTAQDTYELAKGDPEAFWKNVSAVAIKNTEQVAQQGIQAVVQNSINIINVLKRQMDSLSKEREVARWLEHHLFFGSITDEVKSLFFSKINEVRSVHAKEEASLLVKSVLANIPQTQTLQASANQAEVEK